MKTLVSEQVEFEGLVDRVGPAMLRYARRRSDPETAQDAVAEALLVLWRRQAEVPHDNEGAWAIGVTRKCLANAARTARRQRGLAARLSALRATSTPGSVDDGDDTGIGEALARLSEGDGELLRLWGWDDLTPSEIALVLGIRVETVSVRLHRAKKRLAAVLATDLASARANGIDPKTGTQRRRPT